MSTTPITDDTRYQSGYYHYNRSGDPIVTRSSYVGEGPGIRIGIKLEHKPVPGTVVAHLGGVDVPYYMEGRTCWLDFIAISGIKWDVRYEEETWENRARRTWDE